jgi:signal transduction histidine kinase
MRRSLGRLRWQLTLSHLIAIVVTLVSMIAALMLLAGSWIAVQTSPNREAANDARVVARSVGALVELSGDAASLNTILRALAVGAIRTQIGPGPFAPEPASRIEGIGPSLRGLSYIAIVGPDDRVIASSDPAGAAFSPPERAEWAPLLALARSGERSTDRLTVRRERPVEVPVEGPGDGPVALGAYPIGGDVMGPPWLRGQAAQPDAVVVVGKYEVSEVTPFRAMLRGVAIFTAATVAVLGAAFLFALASATLVSYVLSRQLVRRLERLSGAVEAVAAGELGQRVAEGRDDEVGQLARRFNVMAERLATTVAALDARTREAETALAAKRELVANVSHELRTPLASISGHAESLLMLGDRATVARREESLTVLHREARQLGRLVDDLFLLSTTETGGLPLTIRDVDVAGILQDVTATFRPLARREGHITIVCDVAAGLPPACGDHERITQVLGNLIRNALRYTPEGGIVSLRAARDGDVIQVAVEDTGHGIPPEQLARIFERFYRGDDARDRASGGAGLGLAIVSELIGAMGGTVSAESIVGQGSRFIFTLRVSETVRASTRLPRKPDAGLTHI